MSRELPIFPLPLVLFPGTIQPLHVFEPRYRRLLADCLAGDKRFGIAYHRAAAGEGGEGGGGRGGGRRGGPRGPAAPAAPRGARPPRPPPPPRPTPRPPGADRPPRRRR